MEPKYFDFGHAIRLLKEGARVTRAGWNGKGQYLWMLPAADVPIAHIHVPHLKLQAEANGGTLKCLPSIHMKTATGEVLTGWLASQTDIFAEDWMRVED